MRTILFFFPWKTSRNYPLICPPV